MKNEKGKKKKNKEVGILIEHYPPVRTDSDGDNESG
jgi:uncharacterized protein Veg